MKAGLGLFGRFQGPHPAFLHLGLGMRGASHGPSSSSSQAAGFLEAAGARREGGR